MQSYRREIVWGIRSQMARRNEAGAIAIESAVKGRTPVDTGRLRASITHDSDEVEVVVGTNVEYAPHVELGTVNQSPQPYLIPGLIASKRALGRIYGERIS